MIHTVAPVLHLGSSIPFCVPGDKSISHRALLLGALAKGETRITHLLEGDDVHSTMHCLKALGVCIRQEAGVTYVQGVGARGFSSLGSVSLNCGNSGTTLRLLMGIVANQNLNVTLIGDDSLQRRPMGRIADPLRLMGADVTLSCGNVAPVQVQGRPLRGIHYELPVASAQLKSALLLAGLFAEGQTTLTGLLDSRDHTERMLKMFGAELEEAPGQLCIQGGQSLKAIDVRIPGDPSSAAFWIAAAVLVPGEGITLEQISLNFSRLGFVRVLMRMGAKIEGVALDDSRDIEPVGTLRIRSSDLQGIAVSADEIPFLIDEVPLLAILATQARGVTTISGLSELRVKESDRLEAIALNLRAMGVEVDVGSDFLSIQGRQQLYGARIESFGDHRIAMAFSIAALVAHGSSAIENAECVSVSYPGFFEKLESLTSSGSKHFAVVSDVEQGLVAT